MSRHVRDEEGLTLVEMMVAILILGVVLTALAGTLVTSLASAGRQESDIQANAVANGVIEDLQRLPFREVALCQTEATTAFGGATFEGQDLVLLPDSDPRCTGPAADRLVPRGSVVQDGRTYDVQLAVAWVDDDGDGLDASDADGPQDYKRMVVDLAWEDRARSYTARTETLRAPEAEERPMTVQVTPLVTRLRDEGDEESAVTGRNDAAFDFRAVHMLKQSSVAVVWRNRDDVSKTMSLATSDGGFTWTNTVPRNNSEFGLFPNGETLFTFTATSPSGDVTEVVSRKLFLHDLEYLAVSLPPSLEVLADGTVCGLDVGAQMRGMLMSDFVDVSFSHDPATPPTTYALSAIAQTKDGANFAIDLRGTGGFPVPPLLTTEDITATLSAERVVNPTASPVQVAWTITLTQVAVCTT